MDKELFTPGEGYSSFSEEQLADMKKQLCKNLGSTQEKEDKEEKKGQQKKEESSEEVTEEEGDYILGLA